jgi:tetratricopeptide (TPR) repeat protein
VGRKPEAVTELRRALGAALAGYREASPLNQSDLGRLTHYSRTSISHTEAGRQLPGRDFWETVDEALEAQGELVSQFDRVCEQEKQWKIAELQGSRSQGEIAEPRISRVRAALRRDDDWQRDDVNRRELLNLMTLTGSILAIPASIGSIDIDRVRYGAASPSYLDSATLDNYGQINAGLWHSLANSRAKREVLPFAYKQLAVLNNSLRQPQNDDARRRLCALAGDLFQLCGEIFFDSDSYSDAAHCYSMATHASKEAHEFDLWACAMTRHAFINIYERKYDRASPLLDGAAQLAVRGNQKRSTRYWVAAVQAQTYAGLGELSACQRALDKAEQVTQLGDQAHTNGWLRFEGSRLDEERGAIYVTLRRPELAEPALTKALNKNLSTRRRGSVLTDLAVVGAQLGDVDRILMHGAAALDTVRQTGSAGYVGRKLGDLRRQLVPFFNDRHIRYLDSQIGNSVVASGAHQEGEV